MTSSAEIARAERATPALAERFLRRRFTKLEGTASPEPLTQRSNSSGGTCPRFTGRMTGFWLSCCTDTLARFGRQRNRHGGKLSMAGVSERVGACGLARKRTFFVGGFYRAEAEHARQTHGFPRCERRLCRRCSADGSVSKSCAGMRSTAAGRLCLRSRTRCATGARPSFLPMAAVRLLLRGLARPRWHRQPGCLSFRSARIAARRSSSGISGTTREIHCPMDESRWLAVNRSCSRRLKTPLRSKAPGSNCKMRSTAQPIRREPLLALRRRDPQKREGTNQPYSTKRRRYVRAAWSASLVPPQVEVGYAAGNWPPELWTGMVISPPAPEVRGELPGPQELRQPCSPTRSTLQPVAEDPRLR